MYKVHYYDIDHTYLIDSFVYISHLEAHLKNLAQIDILKNSLNDSCFKRSKW